ncbi:MAG TPA: hypothetical protein PKU96_03615 [bacterium]|nr:hypothetical protein [bacterium]HQC50675.1 hypothetical protein [bacterium]
MAIRPFKFKLKKITKREGDLVGALYEFLPATGVKENFLSGVIDALESHLGQSVEISMESFHYQRVSEYLPNVADSSVVATFGMNPVHRKALCEIDPLIAIAAVEYLLGGRPKGGAMRKLSETELGVLQYLILQILSSIYRLSGQNPRVHFRFDRFISGSRELAGIADPEDGVAVLIFRIRFSKLAGFFRLILPDPFIEENFLPALPAGKVDAVRGNQFLESVSRYSYVRFPLYAEIGRTELSPADLGSVEEGDVIILDEAYLKHAAESSSGKAVIRFGDGRCGGIESEFEQDGHLLKCKLMGFHE